MSGCGLVVSGHGLIAHSQTLAGGRQHRAHLQRKQPGSSSTSFLLFSAVGQDCVVYRSIASMDPCVNLHLQHRSFYLSPSPLPPLPPTLGREDESLQTIYKHTREVKGKRNKHTNFLQYTYIYMYQVIALYMEIHVHSTLALRKQKEKKGKIIHPNIAQTNKPIWQGTPGCPACI